MKAVRIDHRTIGLPRLPFTCRGRLSARTYDALERLQRANVTVIPVTAAPAGWCDQMARMWMA